MSFYKNPHNFNDLTTNKHTQNSFSRFLRGKKFVLIITKVTNEKPQQQKKNLKDFLNKTTKKI